MELIVFSSQSINNCVLGAYNTISVVGGVQTYNWSGNVNQEWAFSAQGNNTYRIVPRTAWWRMMTIYDTSYNIGINDRSASSAQNWIFTKV
jgi:hypothetical protein